MVKARRTLREYSKKVWMNNNVEYMLKEQAATLKESYRAVKDVLMLRWAKIRVERIQKPVIYNIVKKGEHHNEIAAQLGGRLATHLKVIIQAYYRTEETKETTTVLTDDKLKWLPASYWRANPVNTNDLAKYA